MGVRADGYERNIVGTDRETRYASSRGGRRFACCPAPGSSVIGGTTYADTAPTFLAEQAASGKRLLLSGMTLTQIAPLAGGELQVIVETDNIVRRTSGGTQITPAAMNRDAVEAATFTFWANATAVAGGSKRTVFSGGVDAALGRILSLDFGDAIMIGQTGSILVSVFAGTTGPTLVYSLEFIEEDL